MKWLALLLVLFPAVAMAANKPVKPAKTAAVCRCAVVTRQLPPPPSCMQPECKVVGTGF